MSEIAITALQASCMICFGKGVWGHVEPEICRCKDEPEPAQVRKVLMLLSVEQIAFLRAFEHTLAEQPVTKAESESHRIQYWVEDDDAVLDGYDILIPATKIWFASRHMCTGPNHRGHHEWIRYNRLGLALRQCLMAGADAACR